MPFQPVDYDPFAQGDPETTGAVQASQAMEPAVTDYLSHMGDQFASSYDPNRSFAQNALDPQGINNAMGIALAFGPGSIKAYHGSPYNFDAFDASKIGTGEGAQSYGHGLYFAENQGVAQSYKEDLGAGAAMDTLDNFLRVNRGINLKPDEIISKLQGTPAEALAQDPQAVESLRKLLPQYLPNAPIMGGDLVHYRYLDDAAQRLLPGKMYEVNIDAHPDTFLDWDKPLNDQSEATREFFNGVPGITGDSTGAEAYRLVGRGNEAGLSQAMRDAGISGVKYLDAGSRAAGDGTSNFVVFDPKMIEIVKKYGLAPLVAGGAMTLSGNADAATHAIPTEHNPFTVPVDYDPFAAGGF